MRWRRKDDRQLSGWRRVGAFGAIGGFLALSLASEWVFEMPVRSVVTTAAAIVMAIVVALLVRWR